MFVNEQHENTWIDDLCSEENEYRRVDIIVKNRPEVASGIERALGFANNGFKIEFHNRDGTNNSAAERFWNGNTQNNGDADCLDLNKLIADCHKSLLLYGGFGCEVVVDKKRQIKLYPVTPHNIVWVNDDKDVWNALQQQNGELINLTKNTNFFWTALETDIKTHKPVPEIMTLHMSTGIQRELLSLPSEIKNLNEESFLGSIVKCAQDMIERSENNSLHGIAPFVYQDARQNNDLARIMIPKFIDELHVCTKQFAEKIIDFILRVNGFDVTAGVTHNAPNYPTYATSAQQV